MIVDKGKGTTKYGAGVEISLSGSEVATAIRSYLVAHNTIISGPATIRVNGDLCECGSIYVEPSGFVVRNGIKIDGKTGRVSTT